MARIKRRPIREILPHLAFPMGLRATTQGNVARERKLGRLPKGGMAGTSHYRIHPEFARNEQEFKEMIRQSVNSSLGWWCQHIIGNRNEVRAITNLTPQQLPAISIFIYPNAKRPKKGLFGKVQVIHPVGRTFPEHEFEQPITRNRVLLTLRITPQEHEAAVEWAKQKERENRPILDKALAHRNLLSKEGSAVFSAAMDKVMKGIDLIPTSGIETIDGADDVFYIHAIAKIFRQKLEKETNKRFPRLKKQFAALPRKSARERSDRIQYYLDLLKSPHEDKRSFGTNDILATGNKALAPFIREALKKETYRDAKKAMIETLSHLQDREAIPLILEIVRNEPLIWVVDGRETNNQVFDAGIAALEHLNAREALPMFELVFLHYPTMKSGIYYGFIRACIGIQKLKGKQALARFRNRVIEDWKKQIIDQILHSKKRRKK